MLVEWGRAPSSALWFGPSWRTQRHGDYLEDLSGRGITRSVQRTARANHLNVLNRVGFGGIHPKVCCIAGGHQIDARTTLPQFNFALETKLCASHVAPPL